MVWFFPQVSIFCLEEGCVCCSHDCCRFWQEGLGFSFHHVFSHFSSPLALFSRSTLGDLHELFGFSLLFGREGCPSRVTVGSWGEEEGKSMQSILEKLPLSLSLLHLYPS
jgi:hypothetical protein